MGASQSLECAFTSPVSIEFSILVTGMQCAMSLYWCCSVVMVCLSVESMYLLLLCVYFGFMYLAQLKIYG